MEIAPFQEYIVDLIIKKNDNKAKSNFGDKEGSWNHKKTDTSHIDAMN